MIPRASIAVQALALRSLRPDGDLRIRGGVIRWRGPIQPKPLSDTYEVIVTYRAGYVPVVQVARPRLRRRDGNSPPHLYSDGSLCLYRPHRAEWNPTLLMAETTIPWASEWLLHYEVWLATGEWTGGGEHPR